MRIFLLLALPACTHPAAVTADVRIDGFTLFTRSWTQGDALSPGGDGLGPYFNESSCLACHALGGPGGAGAASTNVTLFVHFDGTSEMEHRHRPADAPIEGMPLDPALREVVLANRRAQSAQRNAPALFGAGLIDGIAQSEIEALAESQPEEIRGVVRYDRQGRAGRFGWRGQTASLAEFVEGACAGELGLQTPNIDQPGGAGPGLDMDAEMVSELTRFVRTLPAPHPVAHDAGEALFEVIGCAQCHVASLGGVQGLYSDLLVHDLGTALEDRGSDYYRRSIDIVGGWRTPPLWGVGASAPYLHDGRADTLKEAIVAHGGQGKSANEAFQKLSSDERLALLSFLEGLSAPPEAASVL